MTATAPVPPVGAPAGEPDISFVVPGAAGDADATVRTVLSLLAVPSPIEVVLGADGSDRPGLLAALPALDGTTVAWVGPAHRDALAAARGVRGRYVVVVRPGDLLVADRVTAAVAALDAAGEAVVHLARAVAQVADPPPPADDLASLVVPDPAWAAPLLAGPAYLDGHDLARSSLCSGTNLLGPSSAATLRVGVLAASDVPGGWDGPGAWGAQLVNALCRGLVSYDPTPALAVPAPGVAELLAEAEAAPALLDLAAALGILDRGDTYTTAVVAHHDTLAALARRCVAAGVAVPTARIGTLAARLWSGAGRPAARLAVRIVPGAGDVVATRRSALAVTDDVALLSAADQGPGAGRRVLLVEAGEALEVLDPDGLVDLGRPAAAPGLVSTPAGPQVRLVDPGSPGTAVPRPVRALRTTRDGVAGDWMDRRPVGVGRSDAPLRFLIVAPGYDARSGGIVALHRLCDRLRVVGHDAAIVPAGPGAARNPVWDTPLADPVNLGDLSRAVVVYPEIVSGNPLGAPHVVRWLLNRPGQCAGRQPLAEGPEDLLVAFNAQVSTELPVLTLPLIDPNVFYPKTRPGTGGLLWIGKGSLPPAFDRSGVTAITRAWPRDKPTLAALLRGAAVLYSCDWLSAVNGEATFCGTPVVLIGDGSPWTRQDVMAETCGEGIGWEDDDVATLTGWTARRWERYHTEIAGCDAAVATFADLAAAHFHLAPNDRDAPPTDPARRTAG